MGAGCFCPAKKPCGSLNLRKKAVATLFSYVVDHDLGFAPNPYSGYCTLVHCKFGGMSGRRNIVESAAVGDWILGSGGRNKDSAGHGRLIYLMRVDESLPFEHFLADPRFRGRSDCKDFGRGNTLALISRYYFYFGTNALDLSRLPKGLVTNELIKTGAGFRRDYPAAKLQRLVQWFEHNFAIGMHGDPCGNRNLSGS
jgi:hypothetical protein